jgi:hypothetical protein
MPGDYADLSDMALWQAISSGAARSPRDLQRLRRQKEGDDVLYGGKDAPNDK